MRILHLGIGIDGALLRRSLVPAAQAQAARGRYAAKDDIGIHYLTRDAPAIRR